MKVAVHARATREYLQGLADRACRRWGCKPIRVVFSRNTYWYGTWFPEDRVIKLYAAKEEKRKRPGSGRNPHVLLHEVAHYIDDMLAEREGLRQRPDGHGPTFAAICADLFDWYGVIPFGAYKSLCKEYGVKCARLPRPHKSHGHKRKKTRRLSRA